MRTYSAYRSRELALFPRIIEALSPHVFVVDRAISRQRRDSLKFRGLHRERARLLAQLLTEIRDFPSF